jgi:hypothetical protein
MKAITVTPGRANSAELRDIPEPVLTHPIHGLEEWPKAFELLGAPGFIKVFVEVAS